MRDFVTMLQAAIGTAWSHRHESTFRRFYEMTHAAEDEVLSHILGHPPFFLSHSSVLSAPGPFPDSAVSLSTYLNESGFAHIADWLYLPQLAPIFWTAADEIQDNVSFVSIFGDDQSVLGRYYLLRPKDPNGNSARFAVIGQEPVWHGYLSGHLKTVGYDVHIDRNARVGGCTLDQSVIIPHVRDPYAHISSTHHILRLTVHELFLIFQKEVRSMLRKFIQPQPLQRVRSGTIMSTDPETSQMDKMKRKLFGNE